MTNDEVIKLAEKQIIVYESLDMKKTVNYKAWTTLKTALEIINKAYDIVYKHDIVYRRYGNDENKLWDLQDLLEGATNIWED